MDLLSFYGFISVIVFLLLIYQINKFYKTIFNPILLSYSTFSISLATVIYLYYENYMEDIEFQSIIAFFIIFGIAFYSIGLILKNKQLFVKQKIKNIDYQFLSIIFILNIVISLIYDFYLWSQYNSGDERLLLNREMRYLSLLHTMFSTWVVYLSSLIYAQTKEKKILFYLLLTIFLAFFSGSKGGALTMLLWAVFFYSNFNKLNFARFFKVIILLAIVLIVPTWWMYGNDFIRLILFRVSMSGDVYILSFVTGNYKNLIDLYEPFSYLLHPITSIVGIKGYDYPLGAELIGTAGNTVNGTGPNAHLTMLGITFWPDNLFYIILFAIFFAIIFVFSIFIAFRFLSYHKLPLSLRIFNFSSLLFAAYNIFFDLGVFEFQIILCLFSFIFYFIFLIIRELAKVNF